LMVNGMPAGDLGAAGWRKSRRSNSTGNCVEFVRVGGQVAVRDSKDPQGPVLVFDCGEIRELIDGMKAGQYDHLVNG
jgi:hypothetical protein